MAVRPSFRQAVAAVAVLALVGMVVVLVLERRRPPPLTSDAATIGRADLERRLTSGGGEVDEVVDGDPPAGGAIGPAAQACRYTVEAIPPDATVVGALARGYVVLWYRPDLRSSDLGALRKVHDSFDRDVLLVPRLSLERPVVATAWGRRYRPATVDPQRLADFVAFHRGKGPEAVTHPAPSCPAL